MANSLLPQRLKELRKVNNYTQDYVAEALGTTRQTYSHYETGRRKPSPETIYKLALLYNVSADDLLHLSIYPLNLTKKSSMKLQVHLKAAMIWQHTSNTSTIQRTRRSINTIQTLRKSSYTIFRR